MPALRSNVVACDAARGWPASRPAHAGSSDRRPGRRAGRPRQCRQMSFWFQAPLPPASSESCRWSPRSKLSDFAASPVNMNSSVATRRGVLPRRTAKGRWNCARALWCDTGCSSVGTLPPPRTASPIAPTPGCPTTATRAQLRAGWSGACTSLPVWFAEKIGPCASVKQQHKCRSMTVNP